MKLSVIIVNYNVKHYLDNCLRSVARAVANIDAEIIVVDNASIDGSKEMMAELHPNIQYHYLESNLGFSKGNNYGIEKSVGKLVLLLNPDTVVQEDTFLKTIEHFDLDENLGGLGVRMLDGCGHFLPESKRGLPTPKAAFFKLSGLSNLLPKSKTFGQYHVAYLNEKENHDVEVLSGAFMMIRRSVLHKIGCLDEDFFMYGEDIDLSYRIIKAGYKNRYCSDTSIIHYKGESTKKGSVNYVYVFYRAMAIFARKHFEKGKASLFGVLISLAIYFRAGLALLNTALGKVWPFLLDFTSIYIVFKLSSKFYAVAENKDFSEPFIEYLIPLYALILSIVLTYAGAHDRPFKPLKFIKGWSVGLVFILVVYSLLPENFRFSRAVVLIGSLATLSVGYVWRLVIEKLSPKPTSIHGSSKHRWLVVGDANSLQATKELLDQIGQTTPFVGKLEPANNLKHMLNNVTTTINEFKVSAVVVDPSISGYGTSLKILNVLKSSVALCMLVNNKIISPDYIIQAHEFVEGNKLHKLEMPYILRLKRSFDIIASLLLMAFAPIVLLFVDNKMGFVKNLFFVLVGHKTWVGLDQRGEHHTLPTIKAGVINPNENMIWPEGNKESAFNGNVFYLQSPPLISDVALMFQHIENLGN